MPVKRVKGGYRWGKHGHVYPSRAGAERQARAAYANGYRGDSGHARLRRALAARVDAADGRRHLPTYPADHRPFMSVTPPGSSCANCRFVSEDLQHCDSPNYGEFFGTDELQFEPGHDAFSSCSDWWEPAAGGE